MSLDEYVKSAWSTHASDSASVANGLPGAIGLLEKSHQILPLANLITHVLGEHLAEYSRGIELLQSIRTSPAFAPEGEGAAAVARSIASLELAAGTRGSADELSVSDQIRALATAASAASAHRQTEFARNLFRAALDLTREPGIVKTDPANRALAIASNNLAVSLEERADRTADDTDLMLYAARAARKHWELAGTWLEVERAEYRLAMSYLQAAQLDRALEHAQLCLDVVRKNDGPALELFFGYEALARVEKAKGSKGFERVLGLMRGQFEKLGAEDKAWAGASLKKLEAAK